MSHAGLWQQLVDRWERGAVPRISANGQWIEGAALAERVERGAGWLVDRGVGPGDRVVLQLPRSPLFLEIFLAALSIGAVPVPVNARASAHELAFISADCSPVLTVLPAQVVVLDTLLATAIAPRVRSPSEDDPACILYTSGTTGRPKGAVLRHRNLVAGIRALHDAWGWSAADVLVHALPLDHVHGLFVAQLGALWAGATTLFLPRFDPDAVWDAMESGGTIFMGVPTFYHRLLASGRTPDTRSARLFTSGSAPLPASVLMAFERRFGHRILERYGMTEVGITLSNPLRGERRPGSIGLPLPGVGARITGPEGATLPDGAVGELRIRGDTVFAGYFGRPEATAAALRDGEMCTGDLGFRDRDGYFVLCGRASEVILVGGLNVYPQEIETVILQDPAVLEAAAVGIPHPDLGEVPAAAVVPRAGATPPTEAALQALVREQLSAFKVPRRIRLVEALPRNAMGKVVRNEVRRLLAPIQVRPARSDEAPAIADRNVSMARETEGLALDPITALRGASAVFERDVGAHYWIAEAEGRVAGQLMITVEWSDWRNAPVWWIQSVYVEPDQRGAGVFRALYDEVLRRAEQSGAAGVRLYVDRSNLAAIRIYSKLGMDGDHYQVFELFPPR